MAGLTVEVHGNIAAGKTTTLAAMEDKTNEIAVHYENVKAWAPWLEAVYSDPQTNIVPFQFKVLCHYFDVSEAIVFADNGPRVHVVERGPGAVANVFVPAAMTLGSMLPADAAMFDCTYDHVFRHSKLPWNGSLVVYLRTTPEMCFERVKGRAREGEDPISIEYLRLIHQKHEETYGQDADCIIDVAPGDSPSVVADKVLEYVMGASQ
jgi:deoxyadenosine/deoxycytidine kinase